MMSGTLCSVFVPQQSNRGQSKTTSELAQQERVFTWKREACDR